MLTIDDLSHHYDQRKILNRLSLSIAAGEIFTLLGPSGCGKSTLLRIIAGLERVQQGQICLGGINITTLRPDQRRVGLMFQEFALFPHMNTADNIAFGMRMQRLSPAQQRHTTHELLELVGLRGFEKRDVATLSGGEKQRVALARCLATQPRLLMLDEPLGALDAALRDRLMIDLRHILKQRQITTLYVTHDQQEALAMADRVGLMHMGKIWQDAPPHDLYERPATRFAAEFLGLANVFVVYRWDDGMAYTDIGMFALPASGCREKTHSEPTTLFLHPNYLRLRPPHEPGDLRGTISEIRFSGPLYQVWVQISPAHRVMLFHSATAPSLNIGEEAVIQFAPNALQILDQ